MGTLYIGNTPVAPIIGSEKNTGNNEFTEKLLKGTLTKITQDDLKGLTEIPQYMFYSQNDLESADIPEGIRVINDSAFSGYFYTQYTVDENTNKITAVSVSNPKKKFVTVKIPSTCVVIGDRALKECGSLANIEFPNGCNIKYIGKGAFDGTACASLSFSSLEEIAGDYGDGTFSSMRNLVNIDFTGSIFKQIPKCCFQYCRALTNVILPSTITSILSSAFYMCNKLTSISLYKGFEKFDGSNIFYGSGVTTINFTGTRAEMQTVISNSTSGWDTGFTGKFVCSDGNLVKNSSGSWVNG